jgi:hypothetical protein
MKVSIVRAAAVLSIASCAVLAPAARASAQAASPAANQPAAQSEKLPSGAAVLDKYVDAIGGAAAFQSLKSRVVTATMEIPSVGVTLGVTVYAAAPDRNYTVAESEATGKVETGSSDGVAWEISPQRGAILKTGSERDDALRDAQFDRMAHWKESTKSAECLSVAMIDGKPAYKVLVTPKSGSAQTYYFDRGTGLIAQVDSVAESTAGRLTIIARPSDYRKVDGILMAFSNRVTIVEIGQDRVLTVKTVAHNAPIPADTFSLPAEIKALAGAKK